MLYVTFLFGSVPWDFSYVKYFPGALNNPYRIRLAWQKCFGHTCILVMSNMMPPTAMKERAGKSRTERADGKKANQWASSLAFRIQTKMCVVLFLFYLNLRRPPSRYRQCGNLWNKHITCMIDECFFKPNTIIKTLDEWISTKYVHLFELIQYTLREIESRIHTSFMQKFLNNDYFSIWPLHNTTVDFK